MLTHYLTLTSVVFELDLEVYKQKQKANLTLTSVVFELDRVFVYDVAFWFNFNKCCIWITSHKLVFEYFPNLTLTSVVFEYRKEYISAVDIEFNFNKCCIWIGIKKTGFMSCY